MKTMKTTKMTTIRIMNSCNVNESLEMERSG